MHALTGKEILVEDKLFATLGTAVGEMKPPTMAPVLATSEAAPTEQIVYPSYTSYGKILINDTIGFIRDLPPNLIEAFTSTLEDSIHSQLLLHVVDASDHKIFDKMHVVDTILHRIEAQQPRRYVFNKIDTLTPEQRKKLVEDYADYNPLFVSAITGE